MPHVDPFYNLRGRKRLYAVLCISPTQKSSNIRKNDYEKQAVKN